MAGAQTKLLAIKMLENFYQNYRLRLDEAFFEEAWRDAEIELRSVQMTYGDTMGVLLIRCIRTDALPITSDPMEATG